MSDPNDVKSIFLAAVEKGSPTERNAYLDDACGDDAPLRQRVEALLKAHDDPASCLERPAIAANANAFARTAPMPPVIEGPGAVIGRFKLLQQIGEGGFGVVYLAEQEEPVRRKVAIKIIKPGMDSRQVIARFEAEQQALAIMEHQNIARVLDAGATDSGRPYFVMELVKGVPITEYCDNNKLALRERLELFIPVCRAIQHAHQKGVIHRDIKPSNVLVCLYDGRPVPKVIDFGVAKAIEHRLTEKTMFTQHGQVMGTLEYMSPEQAELSQLDIDTRSDIYSLGVLLYELLTGTTPITKQQLREAGFTEMLRMIREKEPEKPSTRLSHSHETLHTISAQRRTEPSKLGVLLRGELDWIVMKSLEKDRTRRYDTPNGFALDVQRYLDDEPVQACPPSAGYRLRKFARKHRTVIATVATFAVVLLVGAVISTWQAIRATNAESSALREAERAKSNEVAAIVSNEKTQDALTANLFEQARAVRLAGLTGRRWQALELLKEAEQLRSRERPNLPGQPADKQLATPREIPGQSQLRTEALAALLLDDAHIARQWSGELAHSMSPDGRFAARVWADLEHDKGGLAITELATGKEISSWSGDEAKPLLGVAIALGPLGRRLASLSDDLRRVNLWELPERKRLGELSLPIRDSEAQQGKLHKEKQEASMSASAIHSMSFSPNGRYLCGLVTSDHSVKVLVWDVESSAGAHVVGSLTKGLAIAFSPDSRLLAFASTGKKIALWNVAVNHVEAEIDLPLEPSGPLGFAPDGTLGIACAESPEKPGSRASSGQTLLIWDVAQNREIRRIGAVPSAPIGISFSPDGVQVAISIGLSGNILVLDLAGRRTPIPLDHKAIPQLLSWTDDGRYLLSGGLGSLKMWEFADESPVSDLRMQAESDMGFEGPLAFSPNGRFIAVESRGTPHVDLYDRTTRKLVRQLPYDAADKFFPYRLSFSPDGRQFVRLGLRSLVVWDVETGKLRSRMEANPAQGRVFPSVGFRADGSVLVGGSDNWKPVVLEASNGNAVWQGQQKSGSIALVSPDGRFATAFASAPSGKQQPVPLVDLSTGQERYQLSGPPKKAMQTLCEFSPDSRWLLALHMNGAAAAGLQAITSSFGGAALGFLGSGMAEQPWTADIWDVQSGKRQMQIGGPSNPITYAFSRDGRFLAVSMVNRTIRVWDRERDIELFDWRPFDDRPEKPIASHYLTFTADNTGLVTPNPDSRALRILNLSRVNEQLRKTALNW